MDCTCLEPKIHRIGTENGAAKFFSAGMERLKNIKVRSKTQRRNRNEINMFFIFEIRENGAIDLQKAGVIADGLDSPVMPGFRNLKKRSPRGSSVISALTSDPLNLESSPPFRILPPIVIPTEAGIQKCFRAVPNQSDPRLRRRPLSLSYPSQLNDKWAGGWTRNPERWIPACAGMTAPGGTLDGTCSQQLPVPHGR